MTELIQLSDAEITEVAGGVDSGTSQSIYISASQSNSSYISQSATATNSGAVSASATGTGAVAAAVGAQASNTALVYQTNAIVAANIFRRGSSGG
jgi:hypothetical protein